MAENPQNEKFPQEQSPEDSMTSTAAVWIPIGVGIGVPLGLIFGNLALGIAIGAAIGSTIGIIQSQRDINKQPASAENRRGLLVIFGLGIMVLLVAGVVILFILLR